MAAKKKKAVKAKAKAKIGTRKSTLKAKRQLNNRSVSPYWAKRVGLMLLALILMSWGVLWAFLGSDHATMSNWVKSGTVSLLADAGFRVKTILVEGREYSDPDILLALINIGEDDPIFSLKPNEAKKQIEKIGWIKSVRVERRLPDTIYVKIEERVPLALWKDKDTLSLIDFNGDIITKSNLEKFKILPMIYGKGSSLKAGGFISILNAETELASFVDSAELVDNRRWNLYLRDGKIIKLPEDDAGLAMRNVMLRHEESNILVNNSITIIDARYQGRLIVRTKLGKVQDYKAQATGAEMHL